MKHRLQRSLGQQLVLTPELRQALHLLQLSALELESEINAAVESNPLLDWDASEPLRATDGSGEAKHAEEGESKDAEFRENDWRPAGEAAQESRGWRADAAGEAARHVDHIAALQAQPAWEPYVS